MIQRLQTIFLILITALSVFLFCLPIFDFTLFNTRSSVYLTTIDNWQMYIPLILNGIVTLLAIICIFLFKNRKFQIKLCNYIMIDSGIIALIFIYIVIMLSRDTLIVDYKLPLVFPFLNFALAFISKRYIKKDDDLVRNADRIRWKKNR